jgi:WD40-like Beta Propeller Repeat
VSGYRPERTEGGANHGGVLLRRDASSANPLPLVGFLILLLGCTHDTPLTPGRYTPDVPPGSGPIYRITFNPGADLAPSWLPDGTGFFYTVERLDRPDHDRCLALLPASGGTTASEICDRLPSADDSVNAFSSAAVAADGRLAFVRASAPLTAGWPVAPHYQELVLATMAAPTQVRVLQRIPYQGPSGRSHDQVSQVQWLNDSALVYLASHVDYAAPCQGCPLDTLASGLEIVRFDLAGPSAMLSMLPGTDQASSVAVVRPDTVYFTVNGDSRVFRLSLASDSLAVMYDFGLGGIARDVQIVGHRLVVVVGGNVSFTTDPPLGPTQRDGGGPIVLVDLSTGGERMLADSTWRHPALSPDGNRVVAELIAGRTTDLWLLEVP